MPGVISRAFLIKRMSDLRQGAAVDGPGKAAEGGIISFGVERRASRHRGGVLWLRPGWRVDQSGADDASRIGRAPGGVKPSFRSIVEDWTGLGSRLS